MVRLPRVTVARTASPPRPLLIGVGSLPKKKADAVPNGSACGPTQATSGTMPTVSQDRPGTTSQDQNPLERFALWRRAVADGEIPADVGHVAVAVAAVIAAHQVGGAATFSSHASLARAAGMAERTVRRGLAELVARGHVGRATVRTAIGRMCRYHFKPAEPRWSAGGPANVPAWGHQVPLTKLCQISQA